MPAKKKIKIPVYKADPSRYACKLIRALRYYEYATDNIGLQNHLDNLGVIIEPETVQVQRNKTERIIKEKLKLTPEEFAKTIPTREWLETLYAQLSEKEKDSK